jgi:hypothetical protein
LAGTNAMGWNHRLQASRTEDGKKIFAVWSDSDASYWQVTDNFYPDIIAYGKDVITGLRTDVKNFTKGNVDYYGNNYWQYASDITMRDGSKYRIPVTTTNTNGTDPTDSVAHLFLTGVYFNETDFVANAGVNEINSKSNFNVSQNYPNPFNDRSAVVVTLATPANLSLEVTNMLGQKVFEVPSFYASTGNHTLYINGENLETGVYFYSVKVNQEVITRKMVKL